MGVTDPIFVRACRREPVDRTPVWFMRQAGRYLEEYQDLRRRYSMLELCRTPELAAEVTLQPLRRFPLDAAIIFADILLPLPPMGVPFHFSSGEGPCIDTPVRSEEQIRRLRVFDPEKELDYVLEALRLVRRRLEPEKALIGFAGAPFTLAGYMIEGGHSRHFTATKRMMYETPRNWHYLMSVVAEVTSAYLAAQVQAGAQVIQLFDSWVGVLDPQDYVEFVQPYSQRVLDSLENLGILRIHFATGTAGMLEAFRDAGGDVIGVDWRIPLGEAWRRIGYERAIQGNLDPVALTAPLPVLRKKVRWVLQQADGRPGHIFNLGHGILPTTPPENVAAVVEWVHDGCAGTDERKR